MLNAKILSHQNLSVDDDPALACFFPCFVMGGFGAGGAQRTGDLQRSLPALSPVMPWMEQVRAHPALSIWALLGRAGCWGVPPFHGHLSFSPMS